MRITKRFKLMNFIFSMTDGGILTNKDWILLISFDKFHTPLLNKLESRFSFGRVGDNNESCYSY